MDNTHHSLLNLHGACTHSVCHPGVTTCTHARDVKGYRATGSLRRHDSQTNFTSEQHPTSKQRGKPSSTIPERRNTNKKLSPVFCGRYRQHVVHSGYWRQPIHCEGRQTNPCIQTIARTSERNQWRPSDSFRNRIHEPSTLQYGRARSNYKETSGGSRGKLSLQSFPATTTDQRNEKEKF